MRDVVISRLYDVAMRVLAVVSCLAIVGCPVPNANSVVGRWQVTSVANAPAEFVGMIDAFQIDLLANGNAQIVPGSGFDTGLDVSGITFTEPIRASYTVSGDAVQLTVTYGLRIERVNYSYYSLFELDKTSDRTMVGDRVSSVYSGGIFVGAIFWEENWTRISKDSFVDAERDSIEPPNKDALGFEMHAVREHMEFGRISSIYP